MRCDHSDDKRDAGPGGSMRTRAVLHLFALLTVALLVSSAHAQEEPTAFTPADTLAAIDEASADSGISAAWLMRVIRCETGGTFNPYAIGRAGELGAAQLHPHGELLRFYAVGYTDPFDPRQAAHFMADQFLLGRAYPWSCR
jgi:soluble lytic murein transglycosylase-like protein